VAPVAAILILQGEKGFWQSAARKIFIGFLSSRAELRQRQDGGCCVMAVCLRSISHVRIDSITTAGSAAQLAVREAWR
jgi:hypothetical protein